MLPDNVFFKGNIPVGMSLAICPSPYVVVDVDVHNVNGFENIPSDIFEELENTFHYETKSGGEHYWICYTGKKELLNKSTSLGIDLRTEKGYVRYNHSDDIQSCTKKIKKSSLKLNKWMEDLFS